MSKTKDKILETSLLLFNEKGLTNVSLRSIADEMKISVGNLQYHFKKREDIINALYFQLVEKIDEVMVNQEPSGNMLEVFFDISTTIFMSFFEFRFFLLDFNQIIREHAVIKKHYKELVIHRERQGLGFMNLLIDNGLMREEVLPNEYKNLYLRIQILSDFWVSSANVQSKKISKSVMKEYLNVINQTIFPYLTETGKAQYFKAYTL